MIASASGARYLATWVDILGGQTMLATSLPPAGEGRTLVAFALVGTIWRTNHAE